MRSAKFIKVLILQFGIGDCSSMTYSIFEISTILIWKTIFVCWTFKCRENHVQLANSDLELVYAAIKGNADT